MLTKYRIVKILSRFRWEILLIFLPILMFVIMKTGVFGTELIRLMENVRFSKDILQDVWGYQLTISAVVISVCLFFLDNGHQRRLGLSYKYIFFHDEMFGKNNVMSLSIMNIVVLIYGFFLTHFVLEIENLCKSQLLQCSFIISLIINLWQIIRLMNLLVIAKYKESVIYDKIRDLAECGKEESFFLKIKTGVRIEYKQTIENEEYDQYFSDSVFTLLVLLMKAKEKGDKDIDLYRDCIAAKICQYERYFDNAKWSSAQCADDLEKKLSAFIGEGYKTGKDKNDKKVKRLLNSITINVEDYCYIKSKVKKLKKQQKKANKKAQKLSADIVKVYERHADNS